MSTDIYARMEQLSNWIDFAAREMHKYIIVVYNRQVYENSCSYQETKALAALLGRFNSFPCQSFLQCNFYRLKIPGIKPWKRKREEKKETYAINTKEWFFT